MKQWKTVRWILPILIIISCSSQKLLKKAEQNLKVHDIGTTELLLLNRYRNTDTLTRNKILIDSIYIPYASFWKSYLGNDRVFINWINEKGYKQLDSWNNNTQAVNPDVLAQKLRGTAVEMSKLTGHFAKGDWYILYGPGWADLGGFGDGTMLIDLANFSVRNADRIVWLYPHELNHQIYANTLKIKENIVLNRILDEGFATYVSYIFHEKKYSIARELTFSETDYTFCVENEKELLKLLADNYHKNDETLSRQFADRTYKFKENYPGAVGYYLGFRIVEEYVKHHGTESWKQIYNLQPTEVLRRSKILE